jgi:hypothetical protein
VQRLESKMCFNPDSCEAKVPRITPVDSRTAALRALSCPGREANTSALITARAPLGDCAIEFKARVALTTTLAYSSRSLRGHWHRNQARRNETHRNRSTSWEQMFQFKMSSNPKSCLAKIPKMLAVHARTSVLSE